MNRDLDGYYFRIERDGEWQSICWSDMTVDERHSQMDGRSIDWLKDLCCGLGTVIRAIGDELDIIRGE